MFNKRFLNTALMFVSESGNADFVKLVLDCGADVHYNNDYALWWAEHYNHINVIKILKKHIRKQNENNITT